MVKQLLALVALISIFQHPIIAQYYYKDIMANRQVVAEKVALVNQKIKTVTVNSFEGNSEPSEGFFCEKKISKDYHRIETRTKSSLTDWSILISTFNEKGLLSQSFDSSELNVATTGYEYDQLGNITRIVFASHSSDDDFTTTITESHQYSYNEKGQLAKLVVTKNRKDSIIVNFITDEEGNIAEEEEINGSQRHFYYYYNDKKQLTDIVHYNIIKQKAIPDYLFEYNEVGQLAQMIVTEEGINNVYSNSRGNDFTRWRYFYNGDLRVKEKCFSKEGKLLGYFEYAYK